MAALTEIFIQASFIKILKKANKFIIESEQTEKLSDYFFQLTKVIKKRANVADFLQH